MGEEGKLLHVYKAINDVQADIAKVGVSKNKRNADQKYDFRGVDDVMNALAPILAKNQLCVIPVVLNRTATERQTASGKAMYHVVVECEYHFISAVDGSRHIAKTFGEAMDLSDKATNKAMSVAYKYAMFQAFCIPLEGCDPDGNTPPESMPTAAAQGNQAGTATVTDEVATPEQLKAIVNILKSKGVQVTPEEIKNITKEQAAKAIKDVSGVSNSGATKLIDDLKKESQNTPHRYALRSDDKMLKPADTAAPAATAGAAAQTASGPQAAQKAAEQPPAEKAAPANEKTPASAATATGSKVEKPAGDVKMATKAQIDVIIKLSRMKRGQTYNPEAFADFTYERAAKAIKDLNAVPKEGERKEAA